MFKKIISGMQSECQTVWLQIRPGILIEPDTDPNCLQMLHAGNISTCKARIFLLVDLQTLLL